METGNGNVRLDVGKAHDASGVSADGRFWCVVATSEASRNRRRPSTESTAVGGVIALLASGLVCGLVLLVVAERARF